MFALTGFMGSGKTTTAGLLSQKLNIPYTSLDNEIEKQLNISINDIFQNFNEDYFREIESELLSQIINQKVIIDLGGGTFINSINRDILYNTKTIFLNVPFDIICKRIENERDIRPLLSGDDWKDKARKLYNDRIKYYRLANIIINVEDIDTPEMVIEKVLQKL